MIDRFQRIFIDLRVKGVRVYSLDIIGHPAYRQFKRHKFLHSTHMVYLCGFYGSQNKQPSIPYVTLHD